jgi:hypothetical protein
MDFESEVSKKIKKSSRAFEVLFVLNVSPYRDKNNANKPHGDSRY